MSWDSSGLWTGTGIYQGQGLAPDVQLTLCHWQSGQFIPMKNSLRFLSSRENTQVLLSTIFLMVSKKPIEKGVDVKPRSRLRSPQGEGFTPRRDGHGSKP